MVLTLISGTSVRTQRITMPIVDLECGGASARAIERALARLPGVTQAYANPAAAAVYVDYDPTRVSPNEIMVAVQALGFTTGAPTIL